MNSAGELKRRGKRRVVNTKTIAWFLSITRQIYIFAVLCERARAFVYRLSLIRFIIFTNLRRLDIDNSGTSERANFTTRRDSVANPLLYLLPININNIVITHIPFVQAHLALSSTLFQPNSSTHTHIYNLTFHIPRPNAAGPSCVPSALPTNPTNHGPSSHQSTSNPPVPF